MSREVKKPRALPQILTFGPPKRPKALRLRKDWTVKVMTSRWDPRGFVHFGPSTGQAMTPLQARMLAQWLWDYSAWAQNLEHEFDERNE